jgi:hypothetical protein
MLPNRETYENKLDHQITLLATQIVRIKDKVRHATEDAMIRIDRVAASLQCMHDSAARHLKELRAASDEAWESVKGGTGHTWLEIKSSFKHHAEKL